MGQGVVSTRIAQEGDVYDFFYAAEKDSTALGADADAIIEIQMEDFAGIRAVSVQSVSSRRAGVTVRFAILEPIELRKAVPAWLNYPVANAGDTFANLATEELVSTQGWAVQRWSELEEAVEGLVDDAVTGLSGVPETVGGAVEKTAGGFFSGLFSGPGGILATVVVTVALGVVVWIGSEALLD